MSGMCMSSTATSNLAPVASSSSAAAGLATFVQIMPKSCRSSCSTRRLVRLSSTINASLPTREPADCPGAGARRSVLTPSTAVKVNVVPTRSFWLTPRSPPIASVSRRLITNPSPVPPYARVVELSTWLNGCNSRSIRSLETPMPVSRTDNGEPDGLRARTGQLLPGHRDQHFAAVGELHRVAEQVDDHLAEPGDVTDDPARGSCRSDRPPTPDPVSYTHLRAHETVLDIV